jgi:hypothetical protein
VAVAQVVRPQVRQAQQAQQATLLRPAPEVVVVVETQQEPAVRVVQAEHTVVQELEAEVVLPQVVLVVQADKVVW